MKRLSILGSTGSIGTSTLDVVEAYPDRFSVAALAVKGSVDELYEQIKRFRPEIAAVYDEESAEALRKMDAPAEVLTGEGGLREAAVFDKADMVVSAIVGADGLVPTLEAVRAGKEVALANKEALVMAGRIIMREAADRGVRIIPVDSEHSAVFQCLDGRDPGEIEKIVLTASGGPFRQTDVSELDAVTPAEALRHPNWSMGKKITIDSATLMNKGLEVIEACWLFGVPVGRIEVVLHPQSIIHSMVRFTDGSMLAQMSLPDMKGPIAYALSYPERLEGVLPRLDLAAVAKMTFEEPDREKYPALDLTFEAVRLGGTMPSVLNAANEAAVIAFLEEKISFTEITRIVKETMVEHKQMDGDTLQEVLDASEWAFGFARGIIKNKHINRTNGRIEV